MNLTMNEILLNDQYSNNIINNLDFYKDSIQKFSRYVNNEFDSEMNTQKELDQNYIESELHSLDDITEIQTEIDDMHTLCNKIDTQI